MAMLPGSLNSARTQVDMRSDTTQLDLIRDDPRVCDPTMAKKYRDAAEQALLMGDVGYFTAQERHDYLMAEAAKYEPQKEEA